MGVFTKPRCSICNAYLDVRRVWSGIVGKAINLSGCVNCDRVQCGACGRRTGRLFAHAGKDPRCEHCGHPVPHFRAA